MLANFYVIVLLMFPTQFTALFVMELKSGGATIISTSSTLAAELLFEG
jgi:hypothetical protein